MKERIVGPPGCGKTTAILNRIEAACKTYFPERIGACSLTNTAVNEMRGRVLSASNIDTNALQNMNTMHGLCFRLLELQKKDLAEAHMMDFLNKYRRWDLTPGNFSTEGEIASGSGEDMPIFGNIQIHRQRMTNIKHWEDLERELWKNWSQWMADECLTDFTGMLERVLERELVPPVDILFVDEAQDQSPLQNRITEMWGNHIKDIVYSGDANQAIFRFAGSDAAAFTNLKNVVDREHVLSQSYRVPQRVVDVSGRVISLASDFEDVSYQARQEGGLSVKGIFHGHVHSPDLSLPGTHMVVARCRYRLDGWMRYCEDSGVLWHNPYRPADHAWNPSGTRIFAAARTYREIAAGSLINGTDFINFISRVVVKDNLPRGFKGGIKEKIRSRNLYDIFDICKMGLSPHLFDGSSTYLKLFGAPEAKTERLAYEHFNLPTLLEKPKVILGTVHSVKGGEADHVWADNIITRRIVNDMEEDPQAFNDEVRCCYVAATRARESFGVLVGRRGYQNEIYEAC